LSGYHCLNTAKLSSQSIKWRRKFATSDCKHIRISKVWDELSLKNSKPIGFGNFGGVDENFQRCQGKRNDK